jgi:hypothetical protein
MFEVEFAALRGYRAWVGAARYERLSLHRNRQLGSLNFIFLQG